ADRVRTTATVWLGSTVACSECHDHKFDPFLTKEFYQLGAFFADVEEVGVFPRDGDYGPRVRILDREARRELERVEDQLTVLRAQDGSIAATPERLTRFREHLRQVNDSWQTAVPVSAS